MFVSVKQTKMNIILMFNVKKNPHFYLAAESNETNVRKYHISNKKKPYWF